MIEHHPRYEYNKQWRLKNKERANELQRNLRAANPNRYRAYDKKHYYADPERRKAKTLKQSYGITKQQWDALLEAQLNRCAICGTTDPGDARGWHTDHCHTSKVIRGILCKRCNHVLSHVKDDPVLLAKFISYLAT